MWPCDNTQNPQQPPISELAQILTLAETAFPPQLPDIYRAVAKCATDVKPSGLSYNAHLAEVQAALDEAKKPQPDWSVVIGHLGHGH